MTSLSLRETGSGHHVHVRYIQAISKSGAHPAVVPITPHSEQRFGWAACKLMFSINLYMIHAARWMRDNVGELVVLCELWPSKA